jgi:hypothetical protein
VESGERFRLFVRDQWGPLTRTAYLLTGHRGTAEDQVRLALEKTHRRWERIDSPEVYVRRVMVNTATSRSALFFWSHSTSAHPTGV